MQNDSKSNNFSWSSLGSSILDAFTGGLGSSLTSVFGNWLGDLTGTSSLKRQVQASKELSQYNNNLNFDTWNKQFQMQNERQDFLMQNQAAIQKQSYENAGLNPAMMNQGVTSLAGVSSPSGGNSSGSSAGQAQNDILEAFNILNQSKLAQANARLINAEAEGKERENKQNKHFDILLGQSNFSKDMLINLYGEDAYNKMADQSLNGESDSNIIIPINEGNLRAYNKLRDIGVFDSDRVTKISSNEALQSLNDFNEAVNRYKAQHPDVIKADAQLSLAEYNKLIETFNNLKKQGYILDNEKDISFNIARIRKAEADDAEMVKISQVFDKLFNNKDASFLDKLLTVGAFLISKIK